MPGSKGNNERSAELQRRAERAFLLAQEWLSKSGVFGTPDDTHAAPGSIAWGYDLRRRTWRHAYTEMAGYALTFFLRLKKWRKDPSFVEYAKHVGEYLISIQAKEGPQAGAFPHTVSFPQREPSKWYFSFDTAICLAALSELYVETKDEKWLKSAESAAKWLVEQAHKPDGSFRAGFDFLHFKTGDRRALAAFESAADWLLSHQTRTGGMLRDYNKFRSVQRLALDATAQAARLFLIRYPAGGNENHLRAAEAAFEFILPLQIRKESEPSCHGGFLSGRLALPLVKPRFAAITTWGTLFAAHALHSYATRTANAEELADELF